MWPLPQQRHRTDVVEKIQKRPSMPSMPCLRKSVVGNHPTRAHLTNFFKHHPNQETNNRRWGYYNNHIFCWVSLIGHSKKSQWFFFLKKSNRKTCNGIVIVTLPWQQRATPHQEESGSPSHKLHRVKTIHNSPGFDRLAIALSVEAAHFLKAVLTRLNFGALILGHSFVSI